MNIQKLKAFCFRSGLLQVALEVPKGALELASAPDEVLTDAIVGSARLDYTNEQWLVPGVPEAADDDAALDAVFAYRDHLNKSIGFRLAEQGGRHVSTAPRI